MSENLAVLPKEQPMPIPVVQNNELTPAQARVDAISSLLAEAYKNASNLKLTDADRKLLMEEFPDDEIRSGARGKDNLLYVEHAFVRQRLMNVFGPGQWAMVTRRHWMDPGWMYADCVLLVRGCYIGETIGACRYNAGNATMNYADALKGAESDALGRIAAVQLGVGLQLWKKGWCDGWHARRNGHAPAQTVSAYAQPVAQTASTCPPPQPKPTIATAKTRDFMVQMLCKKFTEEQLVQFMGWQLTEWPLEMVPTTKEKLAVLEGKITQWLETTKLAQNPATLNAAIYPGKFSEPFWNVTIPVPRAGMKLEDYMAAPDTLQSLYVAMKKGDADARKRFWGLAKSWKPVGSNQLDTEARAAFDAFLAQRGEGSDEV